MNRYRWVPVNDQNEEPFKHWLFDTVTQQFIAVVEKAATGWKWERRTTYLLHHPNSGTEETLAQAQDAVTRDLTGES
jgi:hypothetical protein